MIVPQIPVKFGAVATQFQRSIIALVLLSVCPLRPLAQDSHSHTATQQNQEPTAEQQANQGTLLKIVRDATARFQDVTVAEREHYALSFGCVSGPDEGAMGLHFLNGDLHPGPQASSDRALRSAAGWDPQIDRRRFHRLRRRLGRKAPWPATTAVGAVLPVL